ncbi:MAG TPA: tetratricopeptide repeat protein [Acetobacteraceae bacterium]|jgi:type III secretion protein Y|nr:tetratricopeptide repeat protein [Acetobacteraceae bacterium]
MTDATVDAIDLVHCLGFIYLRHGQPYRAVVLLIVAAQAEPDRPEILRTLCGALIAAGMGAQALDVLDRLTALQPEHAQHQMMRLMRGRALLLLGRTDEARAAFRPRAPHPPQGRPPLGGSPSGRRAA